MAGAYGVERRKPDLSVQARLAGALADVDDPSGAAAEDDLRLYDEGCRDG